MSIETYIGLTSAIAAAAIAVPKVNDAAFSVEPLATENAQSSATLGMFLRDPNTTGVLRTGLKVAEGWGSKQNKQFSMLLKKYCLGETSSEEEAELAHLQDLRGRKRDPRTADELLAEWKFRQRVDTIVDLLEKTSIHGSQQRQSQNRSQTSA